MTETEKLKPCPFCGGKARLIRKTGVHGTACKSRWLREYVACQTKKCGSATAAFKRPGQALTAWNTRPDEGAPAAHRRRSKNLRWEYRDDGSTSVAVTDWLPLYTRPAPALDREGEVKQALNWLQYALMNEWTPDSHALAEHSWDRATQAILAMVGGGGSAGWRSVETLAAYEGEFFIAFLEDYPEVWATSLYHEAMGRRPSRMAPGARKAMADNASLIVAWMPLPDAPASTVEG